MTSINQINKIMIFSELKEHPQKIAVLDPHTSPANISFFKELEARIIEDIGYRIVKVDKVSKDECCVMIICGACLRLESDIDNTLKDLDLQNKKTCILVIHHTKERNLPAVRSSTRLKTKNDIQHIDLIIDMAYDNSLIDCEMNVLAFKEIKEWVRDVFPSALYDEEDSV